MPAFEDLSTKRFGRLVVISYAGQIGASKKNAWFCQCDCGNRKRASAQKLKSGNTSSCGCLRKETAADQGHKNGEPFMSKTSMYKLWDSMHRRCYDAKNKYYKYYGALGVVICERWHDFKNFFDDVGFRPTGMSLDRYPDKNGPYAPDNCRWATSTEQMRNRRDNVFLTFNGQTMLLLEWAEKTGIKPRTIYWRMYYGWSVERALTTPSQRQPRP